MQAGLGHEDGSSEPGVLGYVRQCHHGGVVGDEDDVHGREVDEPRIRRIELRRRVDVNPGLERRLLELSLNDGLQLVILGDEPGYLGEKLVAALNQGHGHEVAGGGHVQAAVQHHLHPVQLGHVARLVGQRT